MFVDENEAYRVTLKMRSNRRARSPEHANPIVLIRVPRPKHFEDAPRYHLQTSTFVAPLMYVNIGQANCMDRKIGQVTHMNSTVEFSICKITKHTMTEVCWKKISSMPKPYILRHISGRMIVIDHMHLVGPICSKCGIEIHSIEFGISSRFTILNLQVLNPKRWNRHFQSVAWKLNCFIYTLHYSL